MSRQALEIVRWICILPVAIVVSLIVFRLSSSVGVAVDNVIGATSPSVVYAVKFSLFYIPKCAAFVFAGALTAPNRQVVTALVLAAIAIAASLLVHVLGESSLGAGNYSHFAAESAGAICGLAGMYFVVSGRRVGVKT